jgi:anti-sigma factor RsiW
VHAYVDGELDLAKSLEVEAHLGTCVACAREQASLRRLHSVLSNGALYHQAPPRLERRIRAAVRDTGRAQRVRSARLPYFGWAGAAAAAILLVAILVKGISPLNWPASDSTMLQAVNDHLRSLSENHLTDVISSNQHTVKPWFDGRLNFTPPVTDFSAEGFPLVGGRLDYLDSRPAAAVVYRRRQHIINLFVLLAENAKDTAPVYQTHSGYNIVNWTKSGMTYWAVSSLNAAELGKFAQLVRGESTSASTPRS